MIAINWEWVDWDTFKSQHPLVLLLFAIYLILQLVLLGFAIWLICCLIWLKTWRIRRRLRNLWVKPKLDQITLAKEQNLTQKRDNSDIKGTTPNKDDQNNE